MLYKVDTLVSSRFRYIVDASSKEGAIDAVEWRLDERSGEYFDEFSQKDLGETIIDAGEITKEEFLAMNEALKNSRDEIGSPWLGEKAIKRLMIDSE